MDVYYDRFNILYRDKEKIEFNIIGDSNVFVLMTKALNGNEPIYIGDSHLEDQILCKNVEGAKTYYIYVKNNQLFAFDVVPNNSYPVGGYVAAYQLQLTEKSNVIILKQTSPTGYSVMTRDGEVAFTYNEFVTEETENVFIPFDLGLTTTEYRYLEVGHVQYQQHHQYIRYDLFRKEFILTKKKIEILYTKDVELDFTEHEMIHFKAEGKTSKMNLKRFPAGKGSRVFHPIKELMNKNQHLHSIIKINDRTYYLYNRLSGIFLMRGYPTRVSGFRSTMFSFFSFKNLYLCGRNTHYAFQANGKYETIFLGNRPAGTFKRPLKMKYFQRFGYFKIPLKNLEQNNELQSEFYLGDDIPLHPMKIKTGKTRRNAVLDMKKMGQQTYKLNVNNNRNLVFEKEVTRNNFLVFKRAGLLFKQMIPSNVMTKVEGWSKKLRARFEKMSFNILGALPKKKKTVIFESFHGKQYSDSPRAIYEYMKKENPDYQLLWSIEPSSVDLFESFQVPYIKRGTLKWFLNYPRAKYWVNNARLPNWIKKPARTIYLQTWHGTPLKKLGFDIEEVYMPGTNTMTYQNNFANEAKNWDFLVSPNAYSTEIFKRAFRYNGDVIESGYPRNDALQDVDFESIQKIRGTIGIPANKKIILYAPTWRDDNFYKRGQYKFDFQFDLLKFKERYGENFVLLTRMHYLVAENFDFSRYEGFIYDVSNYPDIKDLYRVSDILITDYSSVFFDYSILDRPIIFYMYDLEKYRDQLRGFYFDIEKEAPGPIAESEEELFAALDRVMSASWRNPDTFEVFKKKFTEWEDGQAAKKVVETMISKGNK